MVKVIVDRDPITKLPASTLAQIAAKMEQDPDPQRPTKPGHKWHPMVTLDDGNRYGVNARTEEGDVIRVTGAQPARKKKIRMKR